MKLYTFKKLESWRPASPPSAPPAAQFATRRGTGNQGKTEIRQCLLYPSNPGFHPKTRSFPNKWGIPTVPWEERTGNEEKAFCLGLWADAAHDEPMPDTMVIDRNIKTKFSQCFYKNAFLL